LTKRIQMKPRTLFIWSSFTLWPLFIAIPFYFGQSASLTIIISIFFLIGWYDLLQKKRSILRDYPAVGHFRYILRAISPEIHQYFVESNTNGVPFDKQSIELINKRSDDKQAYHPFGTERNLYKNGYEWVAHKMFPKDSKFDSLRVTIGGKSCSKPYQSSIFNISAMSFGALGERAVSSLNIGARIGQFSHNTGEGGLTPYHKQGGDIVLQIGTANFGFRDENGNFHDEIFREKSTLDEIKMIEIKLSQGAKPGHGGLLPAAKNTPEIAKIRMVQPYTDVLSPPTNAEFDSSKTLAAFIDRVRKLSGGKPVGIKLCIGNKKEFLELITVFKDEDIFPDFITVDAAEGGTGAAPVEYTDYVGMRGEEALKFVDEALRESGLRNEIRVIYSGKVFSGFTLLKALCFGADVCNGARGFMFALGCIQSLRCHTNSCPTGVATQDETLQNGLVSQEKSIRVANFHKNTVKAFTDIASTLGVSSLSELNPSLIHTTYSKIHERLRKREK